MAKSYTLTPHDWKTLLCMVLTLKQHMLWLSDCRELCVVASIENLNREIAVNYEQFAGEKNYTAPMTQTGHPRDTYLQLRRWLLRQL